MPRAGQHGDGPRNRYACGEHARWAELPVVQELNGVVRDGVVHFMGAPLPDGTLVKMRTFKP